MYINAEFPLLNKSILTPKNQNVHSTTVLLLLSYYSSASCSSNFHTHPLLFLHLLIRHCQYSR